jgi:hypothetical protein
LCGTVTVDTGENPGIGICVFTGECRVGEPKPSAEGVLEWVPLAQVAGLPVVEDLPLLLGRIRKMKHGDVPFHACSFYSQGKLNLIFAGE